MEVSFKKLTDNATLPKYASLGDAGLDLVATSKEVTPMFIEYGTGLAAAIPSGYVGLVFPRSSISKTDMMLSNAVGVIDSGYRGEIKARFKYGDNSDSVHYNVGDKICQMIIIPYPAIEPKFVDDLSDTARGSGGFGSTGV